MITKLNAAYRLRATVYYSHVQEFMIRSWGKTLYVDYLSLPMGRNMMNSEELSDLAQEYLTAVKKNNKKKIETLDDWINEGAPLKNGTRIIGRATIDGVFKDCRRRAEKAMTLYRFDHKTNPLKLNSWISLTKVSSGYSGDRIEFSIAPTDLIIDCLNLADEDEVIMDTSVLIAKLKAKKL